MFDKLRALLLRFLRVPPEPEPPFGNPSSVRVFRASRRLYYLRLARWVVTQFGALAGIIFWFSILNVSEHEASRVRAQGNTGIFSGLEPGRNRVVTQPLRNVPPFLFTLFSIGEGLGLAVYLVQLVLTYAAVRLDYELRWYIVTDRSLRIRSGIWGVQEVTMSYANLQQVMVTQGPLERLLGISNVKVESAGGGQGLSREQGQSETMHTGVFHGVDNASEIRDLILQRLRSFRDAGLGDPDDLAHHEVPATASSSEGESSELLRAGKELLAEARNLRAAMAARDRASS